MSEIEIFEGRPAEARTAREMAAYDFLEKLHIAYRRVDHAPAMTMEDCAEIDRVLGVTMCKNLFLCNRQKTDFYLLLMPGDKPFRTKELSAQIQSARLSFATPDKMEEYLDLHPGAVSVMGLMNDKEDHVQLLIDEDVLAGEWFGCHPCVNTSSLRLRVKDLTEVVLPALHHDYRVVHLDGKVDG